MIYLNQRLRQRIPVSGLPGEIRKVLGTSLRRSAALTQLALLGGLACLPENRRHLPTALLWQSSNGPRNETLAFLGELAEPMPFSFLATQPAIAAAQIKPFLAGLQSASYLPLDDATGSNWSLLLSLACHWLQRERYSQVLCAQLDINDDLACGDWLALSPTPLENSLARLQLLEQRLTNAQPDTPAFNDALTNWLLLDDRTGLSLQSSASASTTLEFTRL